MFFMESRIWPLRFFPAKGSGYFSPRFSPIHFCPMRFFPLLFALVFCQKMAAQNFTPDWASLDARPTPAWWSDSKFGIFIHWGAYSVPGWCSKGNYAEWYQYGLMTGDTARQAFHRQKFGADFSYYDFADQFKAELFNPDDWAQLFEKAGAKYVVLTSKHHDGYCLWPNADANRTWGFAWNSVDRGPRRDLLGDLFTALRKTSVRPGMYYSLYEWFNPLWKADKTRYAREHATPQMRELIQKYRPFVFWTDGDWDASAEVWQSQQFLAWAYNESTVRDSIVFNDRWGTGTRFHHAGIYTPEYQPDIDFENHAWEESRGMGFSYGYNREEDAWDYNSSQTLVLHLIDKVSRGGNFLLDIGPDEHGKIPPIMQERLLDIGAWLQLNGEAIYGTRRWRTPCQWSEGNRNFKSEGNPHIAGDWKTGGDALLTQCTEPPAGFARREVFFTWNPTANNLYAIAPRWPDDGQLVLTDLNLPVGAQVSFLESGESLKWENSGSSVAVQLPVFNPNKIKSRHAYALKISNFGNFCARPDVQVRYDFKTMRPSATMTCATPGAVVHFTTDGSVPTEKSPVFNGAAVFEVGQKFSARAFAPGLLPSAVTEKEAQPHVVLQAEKPAKKPKPGLTMQMVSPAKWDSKSVEAAATGKGAVVPDIKMAVPCETKKCAQVWDGWLKIDEPGGYRFSTTSDDGSLFYLGNQLVVNNDGLHGMERRDGMALLGKGFHRVRVVYFNAGGGAGLQVKMSRVDEETERELPTGWLWH